METTTRIKTINEVAEEEIIANPTDNFLKLKYADLLEDQGNSDLAAAYRYCGENDKHPLHIETAGSWYCWYYENYYIENWGKVGVTRSNIPFWEELEMEGLTVCDHLLYTDKDDFSIAIKWLSEVLKCSRHSANELTSSASNSDTVSGDARKNEED